METEENKWRVEYYGYAPIGLGNACNITRIGESEFPQIIIDRNPEIGKDCKLSLYYAKRKGLKMPEATFGVKVFDNSQELRTSQVYGFPITNYDILRRIGESSNRIRYLNSDRVYKKDRKEVITKSDEIKIMVELLRIELEDNSEDPFIYLYSTDEYAKNSYLERVLGEFEFNRDEWNDFHPNFSLF